MINDANFIIGTKVIRDAERLRKDFALDEHVNTGIGIYAFKFLPRYMKTFVKRTKTRLFGRKW